MQEEYSINNVWVKIFTFLKSKIFTIYCSDESKLKRFINGVFWIMKTGGQWRSLPERYGHCNSVFKRFCAWSNKGVWKKIFEYFKQDPDMEYVMIDATIVRAHACAAGYGAQESQGLGRSKGGFTTKIHTAGDALGNPLNFIITAGEKHDITQAEALIEGISGSIIIADRGYDSEAFRAKIEQQNCISVIPSRSNRKKLFLHDKHIYKERNFVECFFSRIKHYRRILYRFDKILRNYQAFLDFAGALVWLR